MAQVITNPSIGPDVTNTNAKDPGDPCASNDEKNWGLIDPDTGEIISLVSNTFLDDDDELDNPCLEKVESIATATTTTTTTTTSTTTTTTEAETNSPTSSPSAKPTNPPSPSPTPGPSPSPIETSTTTTTTATTTTSTTTPEPTPTAEATTTSEATPTSTAEAAQTTITTEEEITDEPKSFYSCSPSANNDNTNNDGAPSENDGTKVTLTYDYELHTSAPFDPSILSSFEDSITADLADTFSLINCDSSNEVFRSRRGLRQRSLRSLSDNTNGGVKVSALASEPEDESMADTYECTVPTDLVPFSYNCTPIRGQMTAWISPRDGKAQAELLAMIESGMGSGLYVSDDVLKASYVGARGSEDGAQDVSQGGSTGQGAGGDGTTGDGVSTGTVDGSDGNTVGTGTGGSVGGDGSTGGTSSGTNGPAGQGDTNGSSGTSTNPAVGGDGANVDGAGQQGSTTGSSGTDNNPAIGGGGPTVDGAKTTDPTDPTASDGPPLLAVGIALFAMASLLAIFLAVYVRRKRRSRYFSDGPSDDEAGAGQNGQSAPPQAAFEDLRDPDDVQLLHSSDKWDMRSVYSEGTSTCDTENHTYENYNKAKENDATSKYGQLYGGNYGNGGVDDMVGTQSVDTLEQNDGGETPKMGNSVSALAAMGVASTLAAQSFNPVPNMNGGQEDGSSVESPSTPGTADHDIEQQQPAAIVDSTNMTPGANNPADYSPVETPGVSSHVGTVEDISPNEDMSLGSSTTADVGVV